MVAKNNYRNDAYKVFEKYWDDQPWFGFEQEYFLLDPKTNKPCHEGKAGSHYCSAGDANIRMFRDVMNRHYELCLKAGIKIAGVNLEVAWGQAKFQIGPSTGIKAADELIVARYILYRVGEEFGLQVSLDPKPFDSVNGSGCHTNFSTKSMREPHGLNVILKTMKNLKITHEEFLKLAGDNSKRLIGTHETSEIKVFTYGVADRTASVRIPLITSLSKCGYFEDRRPASDMDPYRVGAFLISQVAR